MGGLPHFYFMLSLYADDGLIIIRWSMFTDSFGIATGTIGTIAKEVSNDLFNRRIPSTYHPVHLLYLIYF